MKGAYKMKPIVIDNCEYLAAADAANYLGLSRARVSQLIKKGRFRVKYIGANALVPISDVKMYKALEGTQARKPGRKSDMR